MQDMSVANSFAAYLAGPSAQSEVLRRTMVDCQIRTFDVTDQLLLERLLAVPREIFLPAELAPLAYSDSNLLLRPGEPGPARSLLPPLILARLIQGARVSATDQVLDIASGSGYSTALLAGLAGDVVAVESDKGLADSMRHSLDAAGLGQVRTFVGPLDQGAASEAPFDIIFINGGVEANLDKLFAQLKDGGRLLAIQHLARDTTGRAGKAVRFEKIGGEISSRVLFDASAPVIDAFRKAEQFTFF